MNFCSECGSTVSLKMPEDDHRERFVCDQCHTIHYQNPRIITGTLPVAPDGRILLCKRNIEPRLNFWTLPAGFMENGETTIEGALRETYEEARVEAINPQLLSMISLPQYNQVHVFYRVDMPDYSFSTTPESNAVALYNQDEIPWDTLAFRTVEATLRHFISSALDKPAVLNSHITVLS